MTGDRCLETGLIEVETRSVDAETTAFGSAGPHTVVVDRSVEEGSNGRGFSGEELLCLAVAGSLSNAIFQEARANRWLAKIDSSKERQWRSSTCATGGAKIATR